MLSARALITSLLSAGVLLCLAGSASAVEPTVALVSGGSESETNESALVLPDGSGVLFDTRAQLVAGDDDAFEDVYRYANGTVTWVSTMPAEIGLQLMGASDNGSRVFVETTGTLDAEDTDSGGTDIYMLEGGAATFVSTSDDDPDTNSHAAKFGGNTADGSVVYFTSRSALVSPEDGDGTVEDVYARHIAGPASSTEFVSTSAGDPDAAVEAGFCGASDNGAVVAFETTSQMTGVPAEADSGASDVYRVSAGVTVLASTSSAEAAAALPGNAECRGVSDDGTAIAFESFARLTADDDNTASRDVFTFDGSQTIRVSSSASDVPTADTAFFADISPDGDTVYFNTSGAMVPGDINGEVDGFARAPNGGMTLLTGGELPSGGTYGGTVRAVGADGNAVVFQTNGVFAPADVDEEQDVYVKYGGAPALQVSTGPVDQHGLEQGRVFFENEINRDWTMSDSGEKIAFYTDAALTADDTDFPALADVYLFDNSQPVPAGPPAPVLLPAPDLTLPVISSAKFNRTKFAVDSKGKALSAAAKRPAKGATLSYSLSEAATLTGTVQKTSRGRLVSGKCRTESRSNRSKKKCTIKKKVKSFSTAALLGANKLAFSGRIGRTSLKPASYVLELTATDAAGHKSTTKSLKFTVVKP